MPMKIALLPLVVAPFLVLACQSAVNLDVQYTDADASPPPAPAPEAGPSPEAGPDPTPPGPDTSLGRELSACPCDSTEGLACCVSNAGPAFCTTDKTRCDGENGAFFRCFGPDPGTDSVCCLHRAGATSTSALASACEAGTVAVCRGDADCGAGSKCTISTCQSGVTIGVCDANPVCPP